ncbi:hypothetical protein NC651_028135 [Populus alba x Populus x berolinensis]|nr:hypothetical protein NC651_028135 [Populus alba x Populus x berolinensis]
METGSNPQSRHIDNIMYIYSYIKQSNNTQNPPAEPENQTEYFVYLVSKTTNSEASNSDKSTEHLQENTQIGQIHLKYLEYKSENRIEDQPLNVQWMVTYI